MSDEAEVVVVTGSSGAGRSTALHALEDVGFFCVDNLPTLLVRSAVESCEAGGIRRMAFGIDVRVRAFLEGVSEALQQLEQGESRRLRVLFLDASNEALLRRFSSTRRPHPLSTSGDGGEEPAGAVLDGIALERQRLAPLRARATQVLDTTHLSVHDLRRRIISDFGPGAGKSVRMRTRIMSFGFKYGVPVDADLTLDVRFIDNPFFVDQLKPLSGLDPAVAEFVLERPDAQGFLDRALSLLEFSLPRYEAEGKSYLTVGVGCTGGRHRSVAISEAMARTLAERLSLQVDVAHRDIHLADSEKTSARERPSQAPRGTADPAVPKPDAQ